MTKNIIFVSAATAWEINIKKALGKLSAPDNLIDAIQENNFKDLSMTIQHVQAIKELPLFHHDPFDRMLIAQAKYESLTLLTADEKFDQYNCPIFKVKRIG